MKVEFAVVSPGGGQNDYTFECEMATVPAEGDYVLMRDTAEDEPLAYATFIVRRRWFYPLEEDAVMVEVEPARSSRQSPNHKQVCDLYAGQGKPIQWMQESCF
jgi:hypothetical protein